MFKWLKYTHFKKVSITTIKVLLKKRKEKKRIIKASEALEQVSDGFLRQNAKKAEVALTFYFRDSRSIKTRKRALLALLVSSRPVWFIVASFAELAKCIDT